MAGSKVKYMKLAGSALCKGMTVLVLSLLFYGCYRQEPLQLALALGDTQKVEQLLKTNPALARQPFRLGRMTPLFYATICAKPEQMINLLVANGADINERSGGFNLTPLQEAAWSGKIDAVKALLAHKADVNATDTDNRTALYFAAGVYMNAIFSGITTNAGKEIIELLLANGADINRGDPILWEAAHYEKGANLMEYLLSKGADVNAPEPNGGSTPLMFAVVIGNKEMVDVLLKYHPDLSSSNAYAGTPSATAVDKGRLDIAFMLDNYVLHSHSNTVSFAAARGNLDKLRDLLRQTPEALEEKDELGLTPLAWAAAEGQKGSAEMLLPLGADLNTTDQAKLQPLDWAAFNGHLALVQLLASKGAHDLDIALFLAVQQEQISVAQFLLDHGANPNVHYPYANSAMPLHLAARQGNLESARMLLEHGAQVNGKEENDSTPLDYAVGGSSWKTVELLFAKGAIIPVKDSGQWSIFHEWALGAGDPKVADILLLHQANINTSDRNGQTPLHFAVQQAHLQAVEWLLRNGANPNTRDIRGRTPLGLLRMHNGGIMRRDIADVLQKYGAKG